MDYRENQLSKELKIFFVCSMNRIFVSTKFKKVKQKNKMP